MSISKSPTLRSPSQATLRRYCKVVKLYSPKCKINMHKIVLQISFGRPMNIQ